MRVEPGQVVRLKSGGVSMTVESIDGETVYCVYFAPGTMEFKRITVSISALGVVQD